MYLSVGEWMNYSLTFNQRNREATKANELTAE